MIVSTQDEHLLAVTFTPNMTIRVAALDQPCSALSPFLTILRFAHQAYGSGCAAWAFTRRRTHPYNTHP